MRRKDLLTIVIAVVVISFLTVFAIYCRNNRDNQIEFARLNQVAQNNGKTYYNGWETAIVKEIKDGVPVPVGFTYVEGKKGTGLIVKDEKTNAKYMWIPYEENVKLYTETRLDLKSNSQEELETIKVYGGFYIAIGNSQNKIENIKEEKLDRLKVENETKTDIVTTHLITMEELALLKNFEEKTENIVFAQNYKALTILGSKNVIYLETNKEKIDALIDCAVTISGMKESAIKLLIGYDEDIDYNKDEDAYQELIDNAKEMISKLDNSERYEKIIKNVIEDGYLDTRDLEESETEEVVENEEEAEKEQTEVIENEKEQTEAEEKMAEKIDFSKGVPIPEGFTYVEGTKETGFKIKNGDNLAFIWVPVELTEEEKNQDLGQVIKDKFISEADEAGVLDEDLEKEQYKGYTDEKDSDYEQLEKSIKKYGGFYISEAELGYDENGANTNIYRNMQNVKNIEGGNINYVGNGDYYRTVKEENITENKGMTEIQKNFKLTYESAKKTCKELYEVSETVVSHLTYGLEYDATVLYLLEYGKKSDGTRITKEDLFNDSTQIGKYKNSEQENYITRDKNGLNGIYGLGGNLSEITMERNGEEIVVRGGNWNLEGNKETLASKVTTDLKSIEDDREVFGIRACLYIKTEYEDITEKLNNAKEVAKAKLADEINKVTVQSKEKNQNIFDVNMPVVKQIKAETEKRIDEEKSTAALTEIVTEGMVSIKQIAYSIEKIENYHANENGTVKEECNNEKQTEIDRIKKLEYAESKFKEGGKSITLEQIETKAIGEIDNIRNRYIDAQIDYCITNYKTEITKEYMTKIKETAIEDFKNTDNLALLDYNTEGNKIKKWQDIINAAIAFDEEYSENKEKYEEWKDIKERALNEISTKITLEEVQEIINKAKEEINGIIEKKEQVDAGDGGAGDGGAGDDDDDDDGAGDDDGKTADKCPACGKTTCDYKEWDKEGTLRNQLKKMKDENLITSCGYVKKSDGSLENKKGCTRNDYVLYFEAKVKNMKNGEESKRTFIYIGEGKFVMRGYFKDITPSEAISTRNNLWKTLGKEKYLKHVEIPLLAEAQKVIKLGKSNYKVDFREGYTNNELFRYNDNNKDELGLVCIKDSSTIKSYGSAKADLRLLVQIKFNTAKDGCPACGAKNCDFSAWKKEGTFRYAVAQLEKVGAINSCGVIGTGGTTYGKGCDGGTDDRILYFDADVCTNTDDKTMSYRFIYLKDGWFITRKTLPKTAYPDVLENAKNKLWTKLTSNNSVSKYVKNTEIATAEKLKALKSKTTDYGIVFDTTQREVVQEKVGVDDLDTYVASTDNVDNFAWGNLIYGKSYPYRLMMKISGSGK